jgi:DNA-binding transcriptional LysR family regulator
MYPPLDLRQVQCFVSAATAGTMTAAADELRLTQSAVSLAILGLEKRLGQQLLVRRRARTLLLTPAGRRFLPGARDLLAHAAQVRLEAVPEGRGVAGPLVVGCFRSAAPFLLPPLLQEFGAAHPDVELDFVEGPVPVIEAALRDGVCDLALVYVVGLAPDLDYEPLYSAPPYALFAVDDPMADREAVTLDELAGRGMIHFNLPPSTDYFAQVFAREGLTPRITHRTSSYELTRALVARGLGYGLLVSRPAGDLSYEGLPLACVPIAGDPLQHEFALATVRGSRLTRQATVFARHCREQLAQG